MPWVKANAMSKNVMLVASNKTTNEDTAQNIADWADVKAGLVTASCRVV